MHLSIPTTLAFIAFSVANPIILKRETCYGNAPTNTVPCVPGSYTCYGEAAIAVCQTDGNDFITVAYCGANQRCYYDQGIPVCLNCVY